MSTRPMPPRSAASQTNPDLESTAELPVLDPPAATASAAPTVTVEIAEYPAEERHGSTDTWSLAGPARAALAAAAASAEERRRYEAELQSRTQELREIQERLAAHGKRSLQLEQARDEALAAQAAAAQRAAAGEQRATAAEQRAAAAEAELAETRASLGAARAHTHALQQRLEQQQSESQAQRARELAQQQALASERRAHTAAVMEDLHHERARAMSYLESLQTLERRREIAEELVTDLQREADTRAAEVVRFARERADHDERSRAQDAELAQRTAHIAQLEQQLSTLTTTLAQRDTQLQDGEQQAQGLRASVARLQGEIKAGTERLRALEAQVAQHDSSAGQQREEQQRLRNELAGANAALEAARRDAAAASAQASSQQAALAQQTERGARLEVSLEAERRRAAQLESELATLRAEMAEWGEVLRSVQQERGGHLADISAAQSRVRELEQQVTTSDENVRTLQAECATHVARVRELESDVHAAEEALHRLEADVRNREARVSELERSGETRQAATDSTPILSDPAAESEEESGPIAETVAAGAGRLLIRSEGGREVVHVLGRKTSIGRTPDNDLQLDAKFVSRHHAVILVGPKSTVIEDLNSTNGVQVNGRRVTRQALSDGDQIAIGRTQYHFVVRKSAEKR
jgi:pSer/pThr/pTyr-binding forkhead associated (FHA) protein